LGLNQNFYSEIDIYGQKMMLLMNLIGNRIGYLKIPKKRNKNENGDKKISGLLTFFSDKYSIKLDNTT